MADDEKANDSFDNSFEVPLSPDKTWSVLSDIKRVAKCIPGADLTEVVDDCTYRGKLSVRLGPVPLAFSGVVKFDKHDPVSHTARLQARGAEQDDHAYGVATFQIEPAGSGSRVRVHTDLNLSGPAARYGHSVDVVQALAARTMDQFAANLQAQIGG